MLCISAGNPESNKTGTPPRVNAVDLQIQAMGQVQDKNMNVNSRKFFPSPGAASDVWSLGCLLVELMTGEYLMKGRPWSELYVSLCMKKFIFPSLTDFRNSVLEAEPPATLLPVRECKIFFIVLYRNIYTHVYIYVYLYVCTV
jgi:serine/threonine protein kinase